MNLKAFARAAVRSTGYDVVHVEDLEALGPHLQQVLALLQVNCVIDVGAHLGEFGRFIRRLGFRGEIVSIEPVASTFEALTRAIKDDPRWRAHRLALGAEEGEVSIHVTERSELSSFLEPNAYARERFGGAPTCKRAETVRVRRLDSIFDELVVDIESPRVFLKLDTQGYDVPIMAGATNSLARLLALQTELAVKPIYEGMPAFSDALACLLGQGFELTGMFPVTRDLDGLRVIEFDCVMIRAGAAPAHHP